MSLTNSQLPTAPNRTSAAIIDLHQRFGETPERILTQFTPDMQIQYCRDIDRVHFGKAPKLSALVAAYGRNTAESWLIIQLNDLSMFAGCKEKLTQRQIEDTAKMIIEAYPNFNLTEFMLFFQRFKMCRYGRFYGSVDPMIIFQSLSEFADERLRAIAEHEKREREQQQAAEDRAAAELKQRYIDRVPDAFTPNAPIDFLQYRLMGYDTMPDDQLNREIDDIRAGRKTIPNDIRQMLDYIKTAFDIND